MEHIYLSDLDLTEKDFKFEFIQLTEPMYYGFSPQREAIVKINGNLIQFRTSLNFDLLSDLKYYGYSNSKEAANKILKSEAIDYFINNVKILRKLKLEKINRNI